MLGPCLIVLCLVAFNNIYTIYYVDSSVCSSSLSYLLFICFLICINILISFFLFFLFPLFLFYFSFHSSLMIFRHVLRLSGGFQLSPDFRQRASSNASSCGRLSPIRALDLEPEWAYPDYQNPTMTQAQVDQLAGSMADDLTLHSDLLQQQGSVIIAYHFVCVVVASSFRFDVATTDHITHTSYHTHTHTLIACACV